MIKSHIRILFIVFATTTACRFDYECPNKYACKSRTCAYTGESHLGAPYCHHDYHCASPYVCRKEVYTCYESEDKIPHTRASCYYDYQCPSSYACRLKRWTCFVGGLWHIEKVHCNQKFPCPDAFTCQNYTCYNSSLLPGVQKKSEQVKATECNEKRVCSVGLTCQNGTCFGSNTSLIANISIERKVELEVVTCEKNGQCPEGLKCSENRTCSNKTLEPGDALLVNVNASCNDKRLCSNGFSCVNKTCVNVTLLPNSSVGAKMKEPTTDSGDNKDKMTQGENDGKRGKICAGDYECPSRFVCDKKTKACIGGGLEHEENFQCDFHYQCKNMFGCTDGHACAKIEIEHENEEIFDQEECGPNEHLEKRTCVKY